MGTLNKLVEEQRRLEKNIDNMQTDVYKIMVQANKIKRETEVPCSFTVDELESMRKIIEVFHNVHLQGDSGIEMLEKIKALIISAEENL